MGTRLYLFIYFYFIKGEWGWRRSRGQISPGKGITFHQKTCEIVELHHCSSLSSIDLHSPSHTEVSNYMSNAVDFCKFSQCMSRSITLYSECDIMSRCSKFSLPFFLYFSTRNFKNCFARVISLCLVYCLRVFKGKVLIFIRDLNETQNKAQVHFIPQHLHLDVIQFLTPM